MNKYLFKILTKNFADEKCGPGLRFADEKYVD